MQKTTYYLLQESLVGKRETDDKNSRDYLLENGKWIPDAKSVIANRLMGFDPYEPVDSPYRFGNTDVLNELEEISEEKALDLMADQVKSTLVEKWKQDFAGEKQKWDEEPGWPSKLVETKYKLYGRDFTITPEDIGLTNDNWDQGFMESIQYKIKSDLADYGATDIYNSGFID